VNLVTLSGLMGGDPPGGKSSVLESLREFSFAGSMPEVADLADSLIDLALRCETQATGEWLTGSVWNYRTRPGEAIEIAMRERQRAV
jgi:hypothetical protein